MRLLLLLTVLLVAVSAWKPSSDTKPVANKCSGLENRNWQLQELRFVQDNKAHYYNQSDRLNSTVSFDGDYFRFNPDGSGLYHQGDGKEYKIKWQFHNEEQTSLEFVIDNFRYGKPLTVHWEKIQLTDRTISYVEYYRHVTGIQSLAYGTRQSEDAGCIREDVVTGDPVIPD